MLMGSVVQYYPSFNLRSQPPLVNKWIQITAFVEKISLKSMERGGRRYDWMEIIGDGPGMQTRREGLPTDDKYFQKLMDSDPIYAVWGYRALSECCTE